MDQGYLLIKFMEQLVLYGMDIDIQLFGEVTYNELVFIK